MSQENRSLVDVAVTASVGVATIVSAVGGLIQGALWFE